jgi:hypothetical protein
MKILTLTGLRLIFKCQLVSNEFNLTFVIFPLRRYSKKKSELTRVQHIPLDILARNWHFEVFGFISSFEN